MEGYISPHTAVQLKLNPSGNQLVYPFHDHRFFQFEAWYSIGQQATRSIVLIIDNDLDSISSQDIRSGKTRWSSSDYGHRIFMFQGWGNCFHPSLFPCEVGQVLFDGTNGNRTMPGLFDDTITFTQSVLRTNPSTDFGECIRFLTEVIGLLQSPLCRQFQPIRYVVVQWAMCLTIRNSTLGTPTGLDSSRFGRIIPVYFIKIPDSLTP